MLFKYKFFSCLLYLVPNCSCHGCLVHLRWVFIKSVFVVGSEEAAVCDILIFKNIAFFRNCLLCLSLGVFIERLLGLFVVVVFVIDFTFDWWDSFSCLFWRFVFWLFLIERLCGLFDVIDCSGWLFFVERLWFCEEEENYGRTVHCYVAVVKPCVKMSAVWFKRLFLLILVGIVCCENDFLFWTSFCERHKFNRLPNSDGYCSCVEENAEGCCLVLIA